LRSDSTAADDVSALIAEVEASMAAAAHAAEAHRADSIDPLVPDAEAAQRAAASDELRHRRLAAALPRLQQQLSAALAADYHERWDARYRLVEAERDRAAERFRRYPALVAELIEILNTAAAVDRECSALNGSAPDGERRRLKGVELTARGLDRFSIAQPTLAQGLRLPDWQASELTLWPRSERLDPALFAAPPYDERFSPEWYRRGEQERAAAAARERQELIEADRARRAFYGEVVEPRPD
jgi:hypothetical protein